MVDAGGVMAASLVDAAVTAAVRAGAPRRTVAAAGAAVATAVMAAWRGDGARGGAPDQDLGAPAAASRRRLNKRARQKEAKAQAPPVPQEEMAASRAAKRSLEGGTALALEDAPASGALAQPTKHARRGGVDNMDQEHELDDTIRGEEESDSTEAEYTAPDLYDIFEEQLAELFDFMAQVASNGWSPTDAWCSWLRGLSPARQAVALEHLAKQARLAQARAPSAEPQPPPQAPTGPSAPRADTGAPERGSAREHTPRARRPPKPKKGGRR